LASPTYTDPDTIAVIGTGDPVPSSLFAAYADDGTVTPIQFNATDLWDTDGFHNTVTNNTRLTVPSGLGGIYLVHGIVGFASNSTGARLLRFVVNNTTTYEVQRVQANAVAAVSSSFPILLSAGDYVEMSVYQSSGGNLDTNVSSQVCQFGMTFQSR
jgi:hypothetical protein